MTLQTARAAAWGRDLAAWRIPDEILAQAPTSPWIHPVALFTAPDVTAPDELADTPSHARARAAVPVGGAVLDVGCGGGRAAFALVPPAARVAGVDHQQPMLDSFAAAADRRGIEHTEVLGDWPGVSAKAPPADVVVCHHVVYNVAELPGFAAALTAHARRRVVLELPATHPLTHLGPLWQHFWGLQRPAGPTADDAAEVIAETGAAVQCERWLQEAPPTAAAVPFEDHVRYTRVRLCLPADRDAEVAELLRAQPIGPRPVVTLWWDV